MDGCSMPLKGITWNSNSTHQLVNEKSKWKNLHTFTHSQSYRSIPSVLPWEKLAWQQYPFTRHIHFFPSSSYFQTGPFLVFPLSEVNPHPAGHLTATASQNESGRERADGPAGVEMVIYVAIGLLSLDLYTSLLRGLRGKQFFLQKKEGWVGWITA